MQREAVVSPHARGQESSACVPKEEINDHPPDRCALRCSVLGVLQSAGCTPQPLTNAKKSNIRFRAAQGMPKAIALELPSGRSMSDSAILTGFGCIFCSTSDQKYGLVIVLFTET